MAGIMMVRGLLGLAAIAGFALTAEAADKSSAAPAAVEWENGGDIYGFSDNPDTPGKVGLANIKLGWIGLSGKRFGRYNVLNTTLESEYGLTEWLSVTPAVTMGYHNIHNVPLTLNERLDAAANGLTARSDYFTADRNRMQFNAFAAGFKARLIERGKLSNGKFEGSPFGLGVTLEPKYAALDDGSGNRLKVFTVAGAMIADTALVPERLFMTVNLGAEVNSGRDLDARAPKHDSKLSASTALSYQVAPGWFAGIEARHEVAYNGTGFKTYAGNATYLGPTFYAKSGPWGVQAAWNTQVAGSAKDEPGQKLNLSGFERHRARLRLSYDF